MTMFIDGDNVERMMTVWEEAECDASWNRLFKRGRYLLIWSCEDGVMKDVHQRLSDALESVNSIIRSGMPCGRFRLYDRKRHLRIKIPE